MNNSYGNRLLFFGLNLAAVILLAGCGRNAPTDQKEEAAVADPQLTMSAEAVANLGLGLQTVAAGELRDRLRIQGEIDLDPTLVALVPARLSGVAESVDGAPGDAISSGDILATISSQELSDAIMDYVRTEREFQHSIHVLAREKTLREKEINSEEQLLEAEHGYYAAEEIHSAALQHLRLLGYTEQQLHGYLDRPDLQDLTLFRVRSPLSGWVLDRFVERGAAIEPGQELFRVADLTHLTVQFRLPLRHLQAIREGLELFVTSEALGLEGTAEIDRIVNQVDPGSRTVMVRAALANPDLRWRPGMPARIDIEGVGLPVERTIPLTAVHEWEGETITFVRTGSNTFKLRLVALGRRDAQQAEILDGIEAGEEVATTNSFLLLAEWENQAGAE
jgi:cobalt-zinc-cadmium efflux system membrane fusion protein